MSIDSDIKKQILEQLRKDPDGLTIEDLSKLLSKSRITITKYVERLIGEKTIQERRIGSYRLLFASSKHLHEVKDESLLSVLKRKAATTV